MHDELAVAARYLADSTERYCRSYEQRGGDDMQTGRAWDAMSHGRDWVRKALSVTRQLQNAQKSE